MWLPHGEAVPLGAARQVPGLPPASSPACPHATLAQPALPLRDCLPLSQSPFTRFRLCPFSRPPPALSLGPCSDSLQPPSRPAGVAAHAGLALASLSSPSPHCVPGVPRPELPLPLADAPSPSEDLHPLLTYLLPSCVTTLTHILSWLRCSRVGRCPEDSCPSVQHQELGLGLGLRGLPAPSAQESKAALNAECVSAVRRQPGPSANLCGRKLVKNQHGSCC